MKKFFFILFALLAAPLSVSAASLSLPRTIDSASDIQDIPVTYGGVTYDALLYIKTVYNDNQSQLGFDIYYLNMDAGDRVTLKSGSISAGGTVGWSVSDLHLISRYDYGYSVNTATPETSGMSALPFGVDNNFVYSSVPIYDSDGSTIVQDSTYGIKIPGVTPDTFAQISNQQDILDFCATVPHEFSIGVTETFAWNLDTHADDACSLIIPPNDYFANSFRGIMLSFEDAFPFLFQVSGAASELAAAAYSTTPVAPSSGLVSLMGASASAFDFDGIAAVMPQARDYMSLGMWLAFIVWLLNDLLGVFRPQSSSVNANV